ncbi:MAG: tRNA (adenosine(37)-N6)-threonylcarbamoyltransferase complex transferase subunit TsaD [Armatimonadetes bacterium]|nr:tRNA (adenosine(37)-N6)-threonylcarbamoyltransferase complex transferase subunit TsaD [Armatimonadota bacterium]
MRLLGIETSCDETSVAVVEDGRRIRSNVVASQVDVHARFGGVVPEIASRHHVESIGAILAAALEDAGTDLAAMDAVATTAGPGLQGALLVGLTAAKSIAFACDLPLVGVHHIHGHVAANFLENGEGGKPPDGAPGADASPLRPPALCLVVSGGHTDLIVVRSEVDLDVIGRTRDDAAGEALDKGARVLGLGYPGGPIIDRLAQQGRPDAVPFPRAWLPGSRDFSFSGLKTALLREAQSGSPHPVADLAASYLQAIVDVLVAKTLAAARDVGARQVMLAGGVAASTLLRARMERACADAGLPLRIPPRALCTDNAAMIAAAGYYLLRAGRRDDLDLNAVANLPLIT